MLGEGFDFPQLKIGAIHSPHKSLAITLQFVGRFARTNASKIGEAKFIAIADEDLEIEKTKLYGEDNIWKNIIIELSESRIGREDQDRKIYKSFLKSTSESNSNISLYSIAPYSHVKIYSVENFNLRVEIDISGHETIFHEISEEMSTIVLITKIPIKPKWIKNDSIVDHKHSLFIIYFNRNYKLLFINSTDRSEEIYNEIKQIIAGEEAQLIPTSKIRKVLANLKETEFFNIGMANRFSNSGETYRIISGSNAEKTIRKSDGRLYNGGHVFAKAHNSKDESITIGYSTNSKVWHNAYSKIPDLISWCDLIGGKISSNLNVNTNSGFDNLSVGELIKKFPSKIFAAEWNMDTYKDTPFLVQENNYEENIQLLDFEILINNNSKNSEYVDVILSHHNIKIELVYNLLEHFKYKNIINEPLKVEWRSHSLDLITYLNEYSLTYYFQDFSYFFNHEWYKAPSLSNLSYNPEDLIAIDWIGEGVKIHKEFGSKDSIHEKLKSLLLAKNHNILIYDHGSGEIADFITIDESKNEIYVEFFHVKGAGGTKATSNRVDDVYEVCGQAIKSLVWLKSLSELKKAIKRRTLNKDHKYLVGNFNEVNNILSIEKVLNTQITIVQPGITKSRVPPKIAEVLAANNDFISRFTSNQLKIIVSK